MNARSDTKVTVCANRNATLTVLKNAHGSILADTLLRDRRCGAVKARRPCRPKWLLPIS